MSLNKIDHFPGGDIEINAVVKTESQPQGTLTIPIKAATTELHEHFYHWILELSADPDRLVTRNTDPNATYPAHIR